MRAILTVDTDHIGCNFRKPSDIISFDYLKEFDNVVNWLYLKNIKPTIFVRIDDQIFSIYKDYLYLYYIFENFGCELGWHPHLMHDGKVVRNFSIMQKQILEIYTKSDMPRDVKLVRIGGVQGNLEIIAGFRALGFEIDSTVLPGSHRQDEYRFSDWRYIASNEPFYIDGIFEIPITTTPIQLKDDMVPKNRAISPCIRHDLFSKIIRELTCKTALVLLMHPDECLSGYSDDLYLYGFDNFRINIEFLLNLGFEFISMRQYKYIYDRRNV